MPERVLITGGAGFIGSFLTEHFLARGFAVRVLDNLDPQVHPNGKPVYFPREAELRVASVCDKDAVMSALVGVDVVIHCAAAVGVAQSTYRIRHYVDTNVVGTATLLNAMVDGTNNVRKLIIYASMTSYGEGLYRRPSDGCLLRPGVRSGDQIKERGWEVVDPMTGEALEPVPIPETAELLGRNVYALSKKYQEELAFSFGETYQIPVVSLRLFNVYGPRQALSNPYTGVIAIFLSRVLSGEPPIIYEDGLQSRDFVSVHDVVRLTDLAISSPAADGKIFNVSTGTPRSIRGVAEALLGLVGRPELSPRITLQFRKGDIRHCVADTRRAKEVLEFVPRTDWETGLRELLQWATTVSVADFSEQAQRELRDYKLIA